METDTEAAMEYHQSGCYVVLSLCNIIGESVTTLMQRVFTAPAVWSLPLINGLYPQPDGRIVDIPDQIPTQLQNGKTINTLYTWPFAQAKSPNLEVCILCYTNIYS